MDKGFNKKLMDLKNGVTGVTRAVRSVVAAILCYISGLKKT